MMNSRFKDHRRINKDYNNQVYRQATSPVAGSNFKNKGKNYQGRKRGVSKMASSGTNNKKQVQHITITIHLKLE